MKTRSLDMKRTFCLFAALLMLTTPLFAAKISGTKNTKNTMTAETAPHSFKPAEGYVPNSTVAIAVAEAVLTPIYGAETIAKEKPLTAKLTRGVWLVRGTLACPTGNKCVGGVVEAEVVKRDGRILRVSHGK
jgi:hypothetical protein